MTGTSLGARDTCTNHDIRPSDSYLPISGEGTQLDHYRIETGAAGLLSCLQSLSPYTLLSIEAGPGRRPVAPIRVVHRRIEADAVECL